VTHVLVRHDLDAQRSGAPPSVFIRNSLVASGEFTLVASFGPRLTPFRANGRVANSGLDQAVRAIEIWSVAGADLDPRVTLRDASTVLSVSGAGESVLDLIDANVADNQPIVMLGDPLPPNLTVVHGVTDGFRNQEVSFGRIRHNRSETLAAGESYVTSARVTDYLPAKGSQAQTWATYSGGQVSASSSASSPENWSGAFPDRAPYAAVDADPATSWMAGEPAQIGQWWHIDFEGDVDLSSVRMTWPAYDGGPIAQSIALTTDAGVFPFDISNTEEAQTFAVPGVTRSLRVTLTGVRDGVVGQFGISDIAIPDVHVQRTLVTSGEMSGGPVVFSTARGARPGCTLVSRVYVCADALRAQSEDLGIHRTFNVGVPMDARITMSGRWLGGAELNDAFPQGSVSARSDSVLVIDSAARPEAAVDGDAATAWIASASDAHPTLILTLPSPRRISGLRIAVSPNAVVSRPLTVTVTAGGRTTTSAIGADGTVSFAPVTAHEIEIRVENSTAVRRIDLSGVGITVPVGISEVRILGDAPNADISASQVAFSCGSGPDLVIDGVLYPTAVSATAGEIVANEEATVAICGMSTVTLSAGSHTIDVEPSGVFSPTRISVAPVSGPPLVADPISPTILEWDSTSRLVEVTESSGPQMLETSENFNRGWEARAGEVVLTPVQVDGWRQAWLLPAGVAGVVTLSFTPQVAFEWGLFAGVLAVLVLIVLAALPARMHMSPEMSRAPNPVWALPVILSITALLVGGVWMCLAALFVLAFVSSSPPTWRARVQTVVIGLGVVIAGTATWQGLGTLATCGAICALSAVMWTPAMSELLHRPFKPKP
jgi:arabinofuranan 3-O-arabinosyltransferase